MELHSLRMLHNTTPTQELRLHGTCTYRVYVTVLVYMAIASVHTYIAVLVLVGVLPITSSRYI